MGDVAEKYAGLPQGPAKPESGVKLSDAEIASFEKATGKQRKHKEYGDLGTNEEI